MNFFPKLKLGKKERKKEKKEKKKERRKEQMLKILVCTKSAAVDAEKKC